MMTTLMTFENDDDNDDDGDDDIGDKEKLNDNGGYNDNDTVSKH